MTPASSGTAVAGDRVLVVDFGAQYAQLIARRVREANVFSEIVPHDLTAAEFAERRPTGIIFSGGPASVHVDGAPRIDPGVYELGVPILGICYGAQLIAPSSVSWRLPLPSTFMVQTSAVSPFSENRRQHTLLPSWLKHGPPS